MNLSKKESRLRRSRQTRLKIKQLRAQRLTVYRSNLHIYASITDADGARVLATASSIEPEVRAQLAGLSGKGGNATAAVIVGQRIAKKALEAGIDAVAFDRSGFQYHGRVRALADAAREAGLKF